MTPTIRVGLGCRIGRHKESFTDGESMRVWRQGADYARSQLFCIKTIDH